MQVKRRQFVGKPRAWVVLGSLARRIEAARLAMERLERTGGSRRAMERWRRQIVRMRAMRANILAEEGETLLR